MKIKYLGHSCFLFKDEKFSLVTDPFGDIGYEQEKIEADYCLCSHFHFDHYATDFVKVKDIITSENFTDYNRISRIGSFHDDCGGKKRGENSIFKFSCGGFIICHMGDIGEAQNFSLCEKIGKVNILLLPVGGKYTINAKEAFDYVIALKPEIVIPMHYRTKRGFDDIADKSQFLSFFDGRQIIKKDNDFEVSALPENTVVFDINDDSF